MVAEKISCVRWGSRIIFEHRSSVKTYAIFKHKCSLTLLFSFGGVKKNLTCVAVVPNSTPYFYSHYFGEFPLLAAVFSDGDDFLTLIYQWYSITFQKDDVDVSHTHLAAKAVVDFWVFC